MASDPEVGTVDGVLGDLDEVVRRARRSGSPIGYFAAMYRTVTVKVKEGISAGFFDDGERMERLDVAFAARYLDALRHFEAGARPTRSWEVAFGAARSRRLIVLQHLLVGVNAHINLDLGIAAAEVAPGPALPALRRDFDRINEILAVVLERMHGQLAPISPCLALLDRIGGRRDDEVIRFSVEKARAGAWRFATEVSALDRQSWGGPIGARDARVARVARGVLDPGFALNAGLLVIRACESDDVSRNIDVLAEVGAPALATVEERVRDERANPPSHGSGPRA